MAEPLTPFRVYIPRNYATELGIPQISLVNARNLAEAKAHVAAALAIPIEQVSGDFSVGGQEILTVPHFDSSLAVALSQNPQAAQAVQQRQQAQNSFSDEADSSAAFYRNLSTPQQVADRVSQQLQQQDEEDASNAFLRNLSTPQQIQAAQNSAPPATTNAASETSPTVTPEEQAAVDRFMQAYGAFINSNPPNEAVMSALTTAISDPDFQAVLQDPVKGAIINPALDSLVNYATALANNAAAVQNTQAQFNPFGFNQQQGLESQRIQASGGFGNPQDILGNTRLAASGGLDNEADVLAAQLAQARGAINNPYASLNTGANIDAISQILRGGLTPEQQLAQIRAAQQAQNTQNYLNFIGNPSAVGSALSFGYNPFGGQQTQQTSFNPMQAQQNGPYQSLGNMQGAPQNFNLNTIRGRSDEDLAFIGGQAAARGLTPSALLNRARSFTPRGV